MKQVKYTAYECKYCECKVSMPSGELGIKAEQIISPYCPVCLTEKKRRKMKEIEKQKV